MLSRLIAFSLSQRLLMGILSLALLAAGVMALRNLPIDAFPDVSTTQVKIILKAPGMTPAEVEARIVAPIEQELLGIPSQVMLRSQSKYAIADITLDFADGTDIYWARQQVSERLSGVMGDLPPRHHRVGWRPSPRRWARCSCSRSMAMPAWPSGASCSIP